MTKRRVGVLALVAIAVVAVLGGFGFSPQPVDADGLPCWCVGKICAPSELHPGLWVWWEMVECDHPCVYEETRDLCLF